MINFFLMISGVFLVQTMAFGATGTPPESKEVAYGELYTAPYDSGSCKKPGYYISGWKIDSTSRTNGYYYNYTYSTDKTMVAQWTANKYGGAYLCNNGASSNSYVSATYGDTVTPSATVRPFLRVRAIDIRCAVIVWFFCLLFVQF